MPTAEVAKWLPLCIFFGVFLIFYLIFANHSRFKIVTRTQFRQSPLPPFWAILPIRKTLPIFVDLNSKY